jgi:hypothetical protein
VCLHLTRDITRLCVCTCVEFTCICVCVFTGLTSRVFVTARVFLICLYTCVCRHACVPSRVHIFATCARVVMYAFTGVCVWLHVCVFTGVCLCLHVCLCPDARVSSRVCLYVSPACASLPGGMPHARRRAMGGAGAAPAVGALRGESALRT